MKKLFTKIAIAVAGFTGVAVAQQDPLFTQYMYNKLIYNPGYAGTTGAICGVAQFRQQWVGFAGAPQSIGLSADMPIKGIPLGVGVNILTDKIGPQSTTFLRLAGSYNKKIGAGTLGIGLDIGILQKKLNADWVPPEPLFPDPSIPSADGFNKTTLDLGLGVFYQIPGKFYAGLSTTHLPAQPIKLSDSDVQFQLTRHLYFMSGYSFSLNPWNKITPNVMLRSDFAATAFDINLTYMWSDMIWLGGSLRNNDAVGIMLGFQKGFGIGNPFNAKIGYSYDIPLTDIKGYSSGTHEIILGICYTPKVVKATTYGNDRFLD